MNPRILHLYEPTPESPFLSAQAAANHWLGPALRSLDYEVVARPVSAESSDSVGELSEHFDVVHVLGRAPEVALRAPAVQTVWGHEAASLPLVAHSWAQAHRRPAAPVAVVPIAIPTDDVEPAPARGDHLVTTARRGDEAALRDALAVARDVERELVVLAAPGLPVPESRLIRRVDVAGSSLPEELLTAAAYLSFGTITADAGVVTAMAGGVPVITLRGTPAAEAIVHGESGFAAATIEDAARWAERLDLLSPKLARLRALTLFDISTAARQLADLYSSLARGDRRTFRHPEEMAAAR